MRKLNLLIFTLLFTASFAYADIVSDLQTKKNNTQKTGISFTVVVPGEDGDSPKEYTITEKGNTKLFEESEYREHHMILVTDNKLYQIPSLLKKEKKTPIPIIVLSEDAKSGINEKMEKFNVPDYKSFKVVGKTTANGYKCQVLQKVILSQEIQEDKNDKFVAQDSMKVYVIEKYGYPTRIEFISTSKDIKGKILHNSIDSYIDFVKFNTNISDKILSLPKNAMIVDPLNKNMFDPNAVKYEYLQKLHEQYRDEGN